MKVQEFPLAWRWTDSQHAVFPEAVLSQLEPLEAQPARFAFERAQSIPRGPGTTHSAAISDEDGCAWLRGQHVRLSDFVTISWQPTWALRTTWQIFIEHWSDFCYPSSDDVTIWPDSERWLLLYHHEEKFEFIPRAEA